jgi:uncharacterized membrane protein YgdD (TMEM256/DUF423 family)
MQPKLWILCGIVLSGLAVVSGAYGAHGLDKLLERKLAAEADAANDPALSIERLSHDYDVAVRYQMFHGLALLAIGILAALWPSAWWDAAAGLIVLGVIIFCGGLYVLVFTLDKSWGARVPFGGLAMILGWVAAAVAILVGKRGL